MTKAKGLPAVVRLPECGVHYQWAGEVKVCRRAEGHRGNHRVSREALTDEPRITARQNSEDALWAGHVLLPSSDTDVGE